MPFTRSNVFEEYNAICWTLTGVALLLVSARLFSRIGLAHAAGLDDVFICIAMVIDIVMSGVFTAAFAAGTGQHFQDVPVSQWKPAMLMSMICLVLGLYTITVPKLAISILLERVLAPPRYVAWLLHFLSISINVFAVVITFMLFLLCSPPKKAWDPKVVSGRCNSLTPLINISYFVASYATVIDLVFSVYPSVVISRLQMSASASIYRTTILPTLDSGEGFIYSTAPLILWGGIQGKTNIIGACIPTLGPLLRFFKTKKSSFSSKTIVSFRKGPTGGLRDFPSFHFTNPRDSVTNNGGKEAGVGVHHDALHMTDTMRDSPTPSLLRRENSSEEVGGGDLEEGMVSESQPRSASAMKEAHYDGIVKQVDVSVSHDLMGPPGQAKLQTGKYGLR
ncbi:MAG: hypothetical protein M1831_000504 [Alyxoria varia]|nr:MAG: hypothetical protein M1831_000504 [Alyxoria varia]